MKAMNKFLRIEPKVYCLQDSHMQAMAAGYIGAGRCGRDDFLFRGHKRYNPGCGDSQKGRSQHNLHYTFCKITPDVFFRCDAACGANEGPAGRCSTSAEISQLFLIDLVYTEYYRRHFENCRENNQKHPAPFSINCTRA